VGPLPFITILLIVCVPDSLLQLIPRVKLFGLNLTVENNPDMVTWSGGVVMFQIGDIIRVRANGGKVVKRRVVGFDDETVHICLEEEYALAKREGRPPTCVGFHLSDVINDATPAP
jgi:hypothetical protein